VVNIIILFCLKIGRIAVLFFTITDNYLFNVCCIAEEEVTLYSLAVMSDSELCVLIPKAGPRALLKYELKKVQ
jgi:hypothetical protein